MPLNVTTISWSPSSCIEVSIFGAPGATVATSTEFRTTVISFAASQLYSIFCMATFRAEEVIVSLVSFKSLSISIVTFSFDPVAVTLTIALRLSFARTV